MHPKHQAGKLANVSRNCARRRARTPQVRKFAPAVQAAKTETVDRYLRGSTVTHRPHLILQTLYRPCCVQFTMATWRKLDAANSDKWLEAIRYYNWGRAEAHVEDLIRHRLRTAWLSTPPRFLCRTHLVAERAESTRRTVLPARRHPFPVW